MTTTPSATAVSKKQVIHSPLIRFRMRAHCQQCSLHNACLSDKTIEQHCILALIADSLHTNTRLNTVRGAHL